MSRNTMLMTIAAVALGIAGAIPSAQAGDNQTVAAAHATTKDRGVNGSFGKTRVILIQRSYYEGSGRSTGPFNPDISDDFEGYPHPK